jgi:hypothetical protein
MEKGVQELREKWSVTDQYVHQRLGVYSPYDTKSYQKFYDANGNLMVTDFRNYYDGLQRTREEWNKSYQRAKDSVDMIDRQYQDLVKQYGQVQAAQSAVAGARAEAQRRLDQFSAAQAKAAEEERRQQQQATDEYERLYGTTRRGYAR